MIAVQIFLFLDTFGVLCLMFATHGVPRSYRDSLFILFAVFLGCFLLAVYEAINLFYAGSSLAAATIWAGYQVRRFRNQWALTPRLKLMTNIAFWLPSLMSAIVIMLMVLLNDSRHKNDKLPPQTVPKGDAVTREDYLKKRRRQMHPDSVLMILFGLFLSNMALGQPPGIAIRMLTPDCCIQARLLQVEVDTLTSKLDTLRAQYRELYNNDEQQLAITETRAERAEAHAAVAETKALVLTNTVAELKTDLAKWKPKTWMGRGFRHARDGLAYIGGAGILILIGKLL